MSTDAPLARRAADDDGELARRAADGDGSAFATLYDRHGGRVFNFCQRQLGSSRDAADATQETFLELLDKRERDAEPVSFAAYLFTAARKACAERIEKPRELADAEPDVFADPERAAMLSALQGNVRAANARLPERQREVLALRELEELSYDDIGSVMDLNRNGVAQLVSRARIELRDQLRGETLSSIAASRPDCERALPLVAMRQDGQLRDAADRAWLDQHLAACESCRVSRAGMQEASLSYRAWVPLVPPAWLASETEEPRNEDDYKPVGRRRRWFALVGGGLAILLLGGALAAIVSGGGGSSATTHPQTVSPAAAGVRQPSAGTQTPVSEVHRTHAHPHAANRGASGVSLAPAAAVRLPAPTHSLRVSRAVTNGGGGSTKHSQRAAGGGGPIVSTHRQGSTGAAVPPAIVNQPPPQAPASTSSSGGAAAESPSTTTPSSTGGGSTPPPCASAAHC